MADLQEMLDRFLANKDPRKYEVPKGFCEDLMAKLNASTAWVEAQERGAKLQNGITDMLQNQIVDQKCHILIR